MFQRAITALEKILYALAGAALLGSVGLAFAAVVLRYGFNHSLEWIEEGARYLALFAALVVAGPVLRSKGHVALDLLSASLVGWRLELHRLLANALAFAVGGAVSLWGSELVLQTFGIGLRTGSLQFPLWLPYSIVPLGMGLLMLFSLSEMLAALRAMCGGPETNIANAPDQPAENE